MAKITSIRFKKSQLFFTDWGLNMWDVKESNVGIMTKMNTSAITSKNMTKALEVKKIEYERRRVRRRRWSAWPDCSQNGGNISSSSSILVLLLKWGDGRKVSLFISTFAFAWVWLFWFGDALVDFARLN